MLAQVAADYDAARERRLAWAHLVRETPALAGAYLELLAELKGGVRPLRGAGGPGDRRGAQPAASGGGGGGVPGGPRAVGEAGEGALGALVAGHLSLLEGELWR